MCTELKIENYCLYEALCDEVVLDLSTEWITKLHPKAFKNCKAKKVILPETLTEIDANAFEGDKFLEEIILPSNLKTIKDSAFMNCSNLKNIKLPSEVEKIESHAFCGCTSLETVLFSPTLSVVGSYAFANTAIKRVRFNHQLMFLSEYIFKNCAYLEEVYLSNLTREIKTGDFENCNKLKKVSFPIYLRSIGPDAFKNCVSLKELDFSERLENVHPTSFDGCTDLVVHATSLSLENLCKPLKYIKNVKIDYTDKTIDEIIESNNSLKQINASLLLKEASEETQDR